MQMPRQRFPERRGSKMNSRQSGRPFLREGNAVAKNTSGFGVRSPSGERASVNVEGFVIAGAPSRRQAESRNRHAIFSGGLFAPVMLEFEQS
jgi:hypothetical protein